jgi:hypothetical protein
MDLLEEIKKAAVREMSRLTFGSGHGERQKGNSWNSPTGLPHRPDKTKWGKKNEEQNK